MTVLNIVARVAHQDMLTAEAEVRDLAEKQEHTNERKKQIRAVQRELKAAKTKQATEHTDLVSTSERDALRDSMDHNGISESTTRQLDNLQFNPDGTAYVGDDATSDHLKQQSRANNAVLDLIGDNLEGMLDELDAEANELRFELQMATNTLQNRSQEATNFQNKSFQMGQQWNQKV